MQKLTGQNLYEDVKIRICDDIFSGKYSDGDRLPSERELQDSMGASRVTIRKSLDLLEEDHLVLREIGRGTQITLKNYGNPNPLDMVVLIAPARNPFFSEFIALFQNYAETKDTLLLYVEKPGEESLEDCLYHLYKRGLKNVVIWLEDLPLDSDRLRRLRAIGMNFVFFDTDAGLPFADCVTTDNTDAITSLCSEIFKKTRDVTYICWDSLDTYSARQRRSAFESSVVNHPSILSIPWKDQKQSVAILQQKLPELAASGTRFLLCCDRECSELTLPLLRMHDLPMGIAGVDEISDSQLLLAAPQSAALKSPESSLLFYRQDLERIVAQIYQCLENQCTLNEKWYPKSYLIPGNVVQ